MSADSNTPVVNFLQRGLLSRGGANNAVEPRADVVPFPPAAAAAAVAVVTRRKNHRPEEANVNGRQSRWMNHDKKTCKCAVCKQTRGELVSTWYKHNKVSCKCAVCRQTRGESVPRKQNNKNNAAAISSSSQKAEIPKASDVDGNGSSRLNSVKVENAERNREISQDPEMISSPPHLSKEFSVDSPRLMMPSHVLEVFPLRVDHELRDTSWGFEFASRVMTAPAQSSRTLATATATATATTSQGLSLSNMSNEVLLASSCNKLVSPHSMFPASTIVKSELFSHDSLPTFNLKAIKKDQAINTDFLHQRDDIHSMGQEHPMGLTLDERWNNRGNNQILQRLTSDASDESKPQLHFTAANENANDRPVCLASCAEERRSHDGESNYDDQVSFKESKGAEEIRSKPGKTLSSIMSCVLSNPTSVGLGVINVNAVHDAKLTISGEEKEGIRAKFVQPPAPDNSGGKYSYSYENPPSGVRGENDSKYTGLSPAQPQAQAQEEYPSSLLRKRKQTAEMEAHKRAAGGQVIWKDWPWPSSAYSNTHHPKDLCECAVCIRFSAPGEKCSTSSCSSNSFNINHDRAYGSCRCPVCAQATATEDSTFPPRSDAFRNYRAAADHESKESSTFPQRMDPFGVYRAAAADTTDNESKKNYAFPTRIDAFRNAIAVAAAATEDESKESTRFPPRDDMFRSITATVEDDYQRKENVLSESPHWLSVNSNSNYATCADEISDSVGAFEHEKIAYHSHSGELMELLTCRPINSSTH